MLTAVDGEDEVALLVVAADDFDELDTDAGDEAAELTDEDHTAAIELADDDATELGVLVTASILNQLMLNPPLTTLMPKLRLPAGNAIILSTLVQL